MAVPKTILCLLAASALLTAAENKTISEKHSAGGNYNIPLWDEGKVPLSKGDGPLDKPFLTVFQPPEGKRNGGSVVVAPGGGNIMLMYGAEGTHIVNSRPAPDCRLQCLSVARAEPSLVVAIEDARNGIISARPAGVEVIGVNNHQLADLPEFAGSIEDLLPALDL
jgi:hypothetical protein